MPTPVKQSSPLRAPADESCFVCGPANPRSLHVSFRVEPKASAVEADYEPGRETQGYDGVVHGGIIAALLDEAMVKAANASGRAFATASLSVRFRSPGRVGEPLVIRGRVVERRGRLVRASATIHAPGGRLVAQSEGSLVRHG
ncbi:MAG: PaaI family thioesterase [Nitrospirota bacterium]